MEEIVKMQKRNCNIYMYANTTMGKKLFSRVLHYKIVFMDAP